MKNIRSTALGSALTLALGLAACDVSESVAPVDEGIPPPQMGIIEPIDVVIIGGSTLNYGNVSYPYCSDGTLYDANVMGQTAGGCLPVQGPGLDGVFAFSPLPAAAVTAAALSAYDIAVLNMSTREIACNSANVPDAAKAALVGFVGTGKKLIIYDSECRPGPSYAWLPFPFTTANPGALGAHGSLTILEDNTLSSSVGTDPYYIDAYQVGSGTDAVGDMNVMTTLDPHWCLDMSGTNALSVTGPVHTYAKYPAGTDHGLIIYNGMDMDYMIFAGRTTYPTYPGSEQLYNIWKYELMQQVDPSNLPCGYVVVGITLTPATADNNVGEDHTVTAALADLLGNPKSGIVVTFSVLSGPNAGETGTATTGATGEATFTYTGDGGAGTDAIQACFTDTDGEHCSQEAVKNWVNVSPSCGVASVTPALTAVGSSVSATGSFTDVGDPGPWDIRWTWGDGNHDEYSVATEGTVGPDSHTYAAAGVYPVDFAVTDPAGATCGDRFEYVVVYDPAAGFVTGGGWIDSPAGAYLPDPSLTGKASFGFVAKYKKGQSTPDGNTEFQFHAADLNFHSSSYDWLVVTGSDYAMVKGVGTINGGFCPDGDAYRFRLWAGDDDPDTFRIRIWCEVEETAIETDVYDNGFDQPLGGGSIVIHTK